MDGALSPPDLANAVTGFCTLGSGLVALALCRFVAPQPPRWLFAYACLVITGVPTIGYHGWLGEPLRVADVGTNLLLAWALQVAVLGDYYAPATRRRMAVASGAVNAGAVAWMAWQAGSPRAYAIDLGGFGGFFAGEAVLILDCFAITGLIFARRRRIPPRARPLLYLLTACFAVGLGLASAAGTTLHGRIWSYHALWHVLGGFGFLFLWAFNHVRLEGAGARA